MSQLTRLTHGAHAAHAAQTSYTPYTPYTLCTPYASQMTTSVSMRSAPPLTRRVCQSLLGAAQEFENARQELKYTGKASSTLIDHATVSRLKRQVAKRLRDNTPHELETRLDSLDSLFEHLTGSTRSTQSTGSTQPMQATQSRCMVGKFSNAKVYQFSRGLLVADHTVEHSLRNQSLQTTLSPYATQDTQDCSETLQTAETVEALPNKCVEKHSMVFVALKPFKSGRREVVRHMARIATKPLSTRVLKDRFSFVVDGDRVAVVYSALDYSDETLRLSCHSVAQFSLSVKSDTNQSNESNTLIASTSEWSEAADSLLDSDHISHANRFNPLAHSNDTNDRFINPRWFAWLECVVAYNQSRPMQSVDLNARFFTRTNVIAAFATQSLLTFRGDRITKWNTNWVLCDTHNACDNDDVVLETRAPSDSINSGNSIGNSSDSCEAFNNAGANIQKHDSNNNRNQRNQRNDRHDEEFENACQLLRLLEHDVTMRCYFACVRVAPTHIDMRRGSTLEDLCFCTTEKQLHWAERCAHDIYTALTFLHRNQMCFVDLHPSNIVCAAGVCMIVDLESLLPMGRRAMPLTRRQFRPMQLETNPLDFAPSEQSDFESLRFTLAWIIDFQGFRTDRALDVERLQICRRRIIERTSNNVRNAIFRRDNFLFGL